MEKRKKSVEPQIICVDCKSQNLRSQNFRTVVKTNYGFIEIEMYKLIEPVVFFTFKWNLLRVALIINSFIIKYNDRKLKPNEQTIEIHILL